MEIRHLSEAEKADLQRLRPVTEEEFGDLVEVLYANQADYIGYFRDRGASPKELELRKRASIEVLRRYWSSLVRSFERTGQVSLWLLVPSKYVSDCNREARAQRRVQRAPMAPVLSDGSESKPTARTEITLVGEETSVMDEVGYGVENRNPERWVGLADQVVDKLAPFITVLIPRILRVLGSRSGDSGLSANQVEAVEWLVTSCLGRDTVPEHLRGKLRAFGTNMENFQADLARIRQAEASGHPLPIATDPDYEPSSVHQSGVSYDLARALRLLKICLYLFVTLAPPHRAVVHEQDMNHLLDVAYHGRQLPTTERRLLRVAGESLREASPWEVDTTKLYEKTQTIARFQPLNFHVLVNMLHDTEERYAMLVPSQRFHPPRFQCVMRCQRHCVEGD